VNLIYYTESVNPSLGDWIFMRLISVVNTVTLLQLGLKNTLTLYPFLLHSLSMSVFSSVIGPFGGFFASGFKRAFKIKVSLTVRSLSSVFK